jgi:major type 1 subunit fimbrin (pilin)
MKKHFSRSISVLAVGVALVVLSGHAMASDGTISFTGSVDASTCTISTSGTAGSFSVLLPKISTQTLNASGKTGGDTAFEIRLTGCSDLSGSIQSNFEASTGVDVPSGRLINTAASGASNIQIQLLNASNGTPILAGNALASQNSLGATLTSSGGTGATGSATLRYFARYYATGAATAGPVTSQVTYSLVFP